MQRVPRGARRAATQQGTRTTNTPRSSALAPLRKAARGSRATTAELGLAAIAIATGEAAAIWTAPRSSQQACGSCHGLPPPAPHPQSDRCDACHSEVIDAEQRNRPAGPSRRRQASVCGRARARPAMEAMTIPRPLLTPSATLQRARIGVGAHQAHLQGGAASRALACAECHSVPERVDSPGHADGLPAEVALSGVATTGGRMPHWDRATMTCADGWCHGPGLASLGPSPSWITTGPFGCTAATVLRPPRRIHKSATALAVTPRSLPKMIETIIDRNRHVDGIIDVSFNEACTTCHGSVNPAPPLRSFRLLQHELAGSRCASSPSHRQLTRRAPCRAANVIRCRSKRSPRGTWTHLRPPS